MGSASRVPLQRLSWLGQLRQRCGDRVAAFEIAASSAVPARLEAYPGARPPLGGDPAWSVLIRTGGRGTGRSAQRPPECELGEAVGADSITDAVLATSLSQAEALWALRENISEAQRVEGGVSIKHDISVSSQSHPGIHRTAARCGAPLRVRPDLRIVTFGHIGDGNLHYNLPSPMYCRTPTSLIGRPRSTNRPRPGGELGGSISAEHGLGQLKRTEIVRFKSEVELDLMRTIKRSLDPAGLMNPGKVV